MKPEMDRIQTILAQALRQAAEERENFLAEACKGEPEMRSQVESLLQAHAQAGDFLGKTVMLPDSDFTVERTGTMIGRYKLLEKFGEGGFGVVWMAGQEEPVRRRVALKIIKAGMDTRQVLARFEAERQALAMLEHPNIARVFDGGATDTGRPYFVMELVKGIPITTYCDANKLSTRDRLALFIQVCQAVQHAHQKGIIHRDLKPSNILVTEQDGAPVPKVIDFGVAKATQARLTERTLFTGLHQMIGTPTYMSPEQAGLGALDIDTRSDIYALGALLYELLTGRTPFTKEEFEKAGSDEIFRLIREQDPPKPSTRLSTLTHEELTTISTRRQSEPAKLNKLLRGDLDWVVMKAMEKDRRHRYETPDALAQDVARHLKSEPVLAGPPSALYRFGKMVRRHRASFVAGTAVTASLVVGLTLSIALFFQERAARQSSLQEKRRAHEQAAIATTVNEFLQTDLLAQASPDADPEDRPEPDLKVRTVLDRASRRIEGRFMNQPQVEAALRMTLAQAYRELGEYTNGELHLRRALEIYRRELGETNYATLRAAAQLGDAERHLGHAAEAEALLKQTLDRERQVFGPHHTNTLRTMIYLAQVFHESGRTNAGRALLEEVLQAGMIYPGPESDGVIWVLSCLTDMLAAEGKWPEAEAKARQALAMQRKLHGSENLSAAGILGGLSGILLKQERPAEAEPLSREAVGLLRRFLGSEHLEVVHAMQDLARCLDEQGKLTEAEATYREILAIQKRLFGSDHAEVAKSLNLLAEVLENEGKFTEAEATYRETLAMQKRLLGDEHMDISGSLNNLALVLKAQGKLVEAEAMFREALAMSQKLQRDHPYVANQLENLAAMLEARGDWAGAEAMCREVLAIRKKSAAADPKRVAMSLSHLAEALRNEGKFTEAEATYRETLAMQKRLLGDEHMVVSGSLNNLALVLKAQGKLVEAEAMFREALAMSQKLQRDHPYVAIQLENLAAMLEARGDLAGAEAMRREALAIQKKPSPSPITK
jgi:serine/threonine protein kinase/tetratricopeptide (TPR) repeat protein